MIDNVKKQLRLKIKQEREALTYNEKTQCDMNIFKNILESGLLNKFNTILIYLSTDIEVNTKNIINYCFEKNINIAVPRCVGKRKMKFFYYNKNSVVEKSEYGIYEPIPDKNILVENFENSLCIVPGLAFDKKGYRLGYGGGFYDTFIINNPNITTVGICYEKHIMEDLPAGIYDKFVNYVITDKRSYKIMEV